MFAEQAGAPEDIFVKDRSRTGPVTGRSTYLATWVVSGCIFKDTALPHRCGDSLDQGQGTR